MADDWPYDADQHDPLAKLRIPVVRNPYPAWSYAVCLMIDTRDRALWPSLRPDEDEVRQIAAFLEYRVARYIGRTRNASRPFDTAAGVNTVILQKRMDGGWAHRMDTWRDRDSMWPDPGTVLTLLDLLDHVHRYVPDDWGAWKASHPEAFRKAESGG